MGKIDGPRRDTALFPGDPDPGRMRMSYTTISLEGFLQEFQSVSGGSYPRRFCFVLGAGASKASGIKTGESW